MEIERKFVLKEAPASVIEHLSATHIDQGYLVCNDNVELRIRKRDNQYTLTSKAGNGLIREEKETTISAEAFAIMWPFTENRQLSKKRYTFDYQGQTCELDIYEGNLEGLIVLEAEFPSEQQAKQFVPPNYCHQEVTGDTKFKNATLAKMAETSIC